jgi:hypothetical protein
VTFHRNRYVIDALQVAQAQVDILTGKRDKDAAAEVLAWFIVQLFDLGPVTPEVSAGMLKRWLLGEYYEDNSATMVQALIEEGAHQLGG